MHQARLNHIQADDFLLLQDMKVNTAQFMQLYAWYSWPNVVLCFFGGFLLDRVFGIRYRAVLSIFENCVMSQLWDQESANLLSHAVFVLFCFPGWEP